MGASRHAMRCVFVRHCQVKREGSRTKQHAITALRIHVAGPETFSKASMPDWHWQAGLGVANPKVVAEWTYLGTRTGRSSHCYPSHLCSLCVARPRPFLSPL